MRYLAAINQLSDRVQNEGRNNINYGLQNLNGYRRPDGSFGFWSEVGDKSVWVTAYVAKLMSYAKDYGSINPRHIAEARASQKPPFCSRI